MATPHYFQVPDLSGCGRFKGGESAARWLNRLKWQFRRAGYDIPPISGILQAIDMQCEGEAATFLDSSPALREALDRAENGTAVLKDLTDVEQALKDRFPATLVDKLNDRPVSDLNELAQGKDETLAAYYSRVQNLLRRMGARDRPREQTPQTNVLSPALTALEINMLETIIGRFVDGLRNQVLRAECIDKNARNCKSLWLAYDVVRNCQSIIEEKDNIAKSYRSKTRQEMLEKMVADRTGVSVDQALAAQYPWTVASGMTTLATSASPLFPPSGPPYFPTSGSPLFPIAHQSTWASQGTTGPRWPLPDWSGRHQHASLNTRGPSIAPTSSSSSGSSNTPHTTATAAAPSAPSSTFPPRDAPFGNSTYGRGRAGYEKIPPRETSKNPVVNGSYQLRPFEKVCFRCGELGHVSMACLATKEQQLLPWETATLKAILFPQGNNGQAGAARNLNSRSTTLDFGGGSASDGYEAHTAQLFYEQIQDSSPWQFQEQRSGKPDLHVHFEEDERMCREARETPSDSGIDDPEASAEGGLRSQSLTLVLEKESPTSLGGLSEMEDDLREEVVELASYLGTASHDEPPPKRRRDGSGAIPIVVEGEKKGKGTKPRKGLQQIHGLDGEAVFDFKSLAKKIQVSLTLMDLFQISPETSKQFRHFSTRKNARAEKRAARKIAALKRSEAADPLGSKAAEVERIVVPSRAGSLEILDNVTSREHQEENGSSLCKLVRSFCLDVALRFKRGDEMMSTVLPPKSTQADQGSDVNVISNKLVQQLGLKRRLLKDLVTRPLHLLTSDGGRCEIHEFVLLNVGVRGIWRSVWAIVRPKSQPGDCLLLLGIPWLWDVLAKFDIRASTLTIGDVHDGETQTTLVGPLLAPVGRHRIALGAAGPIADPVNHLRVPPTSEEQAWDSEDSDDESSDSDSTDESSDSEN